MIEVPVFNQNGDRIESMQVDVVPRLDEEGGERTCGQAVRPLVAHADHMDHTARLAHAALLSGVTWPLLPARGR